MRRALELHRTTHPRASTTDFARRVASVLEPDDAEAEPSFRRALSASLAGKAECKSTQAPVSFDVHAWDEVALTNGYVRVQISRMCRDSVIDLYERHARDFDRDRGRSLQEKAWLDRFLRLVRKGGSVLDIGCGVAEPIARYIIEAGFGVVGIDSSPSMVEICRRRFPNSEWLVGDMRELSLARRFDGVLAWDSFFHLHMADQRGMFPLFSAHALPGAPLMFTSGPSAGETIGSYLGEPLYNASLDPTEYDELLRSNGFSVKEFRATDPDCGEHTIWLATRDDGVTPNDSIASAS